MAKTNNKSMDSAKWTAKEAPDCGQVSKQSLTSSAKY